MWLPACSILQSHDFHDRRLEPTVILISIDGFRWDYLNRGVSPNLAKIAAEGARATALVPVFPSLTFPNHFSIVTGVYPEKHGIVANEMIDPKTGKHFTIGDRSAVDDPMWWQSEPLWVTLERLGKRTATMFWVGSTAPIGGVRPSYYRPYDKTVPKEQRVDQILEWLDKPDAARPNFLTLYFDDVDSAGHAFGPDSDAVRGAIQGVDAAIGRLLAGLKDRELDLGVHVLVVSDHGMAAIDKDHVIPTEKWFAGKSVETVGNGALVGVFPKPDFKDEKNFFRALARAHPNVKLYPKSEIPERFNYRKNDRIPPYILLADEGWYMSLKRASDAAPGGAHGYDPQYPSMHGIFVGRGPQLQVGATLPSFENIHVYALVAKILGIPAEAMAGRDADPKEIAPLLRHR